MNLSLNEVEALVKKACRGSGLNWGASAEVARTMRWLVGHQPDALTDLTQLLRNNDQVSTAAVSPGNLLSPWLAASGHLSPLMAGLSLCDVADQLSDEPLYMEQVDSPRLLIGFLGRAASARALTLALVTEKATATTDGIGLAAAGDWATAQRVQVRVVAPQPLPAAQTSRVTIDRPTFEALLAFGERTYAPATEQSRLSGAGAGLSDND